MAKWKVVMKQKGITIEGIIEANKPTTIRDLIREKHPDCKIISITQWDVNKKRK